MAVVTGAAAGLAGALARLRMLAFDVSYAPKTVGGPHGEAALTSTQTIAAGVAAGVIYASFHGPRRHAATLRAGVTLGACLYAATGLAGVLRRGMASSLAKPPTFPEAAGGLLRHLASGIATAVTFGKVTRMLDEHARHSEALQASSTAP